MLSGCMPRTSLVRISTSFSMLMFLQSSGWERNEVSPNSGGIRGPTLTLG